MPKMPVFDWEAGDFKLDDLGKVATVNDEDPKLVEQIVMKALQTPRGAFLIYATDDPDTDHKYGSDVRVVLAADVSQETRRTELERVTREAVIFDTRITGMDEVTVTVKGGDSVEISGTVQSIYGAVAIQGANG